MSRAPVPDQEVPALKALIVGLCVLLVMTPATAAANGQQESARVKSGTSKHAKSKPLTVEQKLALKVKAARKYRGAVRFFETRRALLTLSSGKRAHALARAKHRLAKTKREIRYYRQLVRAREDLRLARRLAHASPKVAICEVFGRYCDQALAVAWCESGHQTTARNGQYLGLFQMGTYARQISGHGDTAYEQARAAYRFFVLSGRDWSPWSCRWAAV
jgi:hypothetical protein